MKTIVTKTINWINNNDWVLMAAIMLLAGITRIVDMGCLPNGYYQDEAFVALNAVDLLKEGRDAGGNIWPVYMSSWGDGQSAMYIWLLIPVLAITGGNVNLWAVRTPQYIISLLTILALYGIVKRLFNSSKKGLLAAFLLAICPWHFMMSRWALDANMAPGFIIFALYFFVRSLEKEQYLILSALFYGLTLYCYAVTWPIVPVIVLLEFVYGLKAGKLKINKYSILSVFVLFVTAMPLILYFLVNKGFIAPIELSFISIPKAMNFRSAEVSLGIDSVIYNFKQLARLLIVHNTGTVWHVIEPWGLFYRSGLVFMGIGSLAFIINVVKGIRQKSNLQPEIVLAIQLFGGLLLAALVTPQFHQTNILFIPMIILEAYGIWNVYTLLKNRKSVVSIIYAIVVGSVSVILFMLFVRDYFGPYRQLANTYFAEGIEDCVNTAMNAAKEKGIKKITAEKATQWPRLILFSETLPSEYFTDELVYESKPTPWSFSKDDITIQTRIDYENLSDDSIYIIYFTDKELFEDRFDLISITDWYVAIPKGD